MEGSGSADFGSGESGASVPCFPLCPSPSVTDGTESERLDAVLIAVSLSLVLTLAFLALSIVLLAYLLNKYCNKIVNETSTTDNASKRRYSRAVSEAAKSSLQEKLHDRSSIHYEGTLLLPRKQIHQPLESTKRLSQQELVSLDLQGRLVALEFPHSEVCILGDVMELNTGKIYKGEAFKLTENKTMSTVLIKSLRIEATNKQMEAFNEEICLISSIDHKNVLSLLAISTSEAPQYMIYEYMEFGSLKEFLLSTASVWLDAMEVESTLTSLMDVETSTTVSSHTAQTLVGTDEMIAIAVQVAEGLEHLMKRGIILKDIGTRNCQVGDGLAVKLSNFGLSYELDSTDYVILEDITDSQECLPVPLRWLAPETLQNQAYTVHSDIWSYGVLLWEIFSLGAQPYTSLTNEQIKDSITSYRVLPRPENCPKIVYKTMRMCWNPIPTKRCSIDEVRRSLESSVARFDLENVSRRFSSKIPSTPDLLRKSNHITVLY